MIESSTGRVINSYHCIGLYFQNERNDKFAHTLHGNETLEPLFKYRDVCLKNMTTSPQVAASIEKRTTSNWYHCRITFKSSRTSLIISVTSGKYFFNPRLKPSNLWSNNLAVRLKSSFPAGQTLKYLPLIKFNCISGNG